MLFNIIIFIILIITLYLLAIMPKLRSNPDSNRFDGWMYAHRGLHNNQSEAPENSLAAFRLAVDHKYGIELDVQLTKDGIPVVFHDYTLTRVCGEKKKVVEIDYKDLCQYKLFSSKERIPTLMEALTCIDGKVPIIIELKIPWSAKRTCEVVAKVLSKYQGVYCIESFNPFGLIWYRKNLPQVVRGQLSSDFIKEKTKGSKVQFFLLKNLLLNFQTKPDFIAYHYIYKRSLSFTLCKRLYRAKTVAWTIQSQKALEESHDMFDLFIFDSFIPKK